MQLEKVYKIISNSHETLKKKFDEETESWKPDQPPATSIMSCFAEVLLLQESEFTDNQYEAVFLIIEDLLLNGDEDIIDIISTGLLETLVNLSNQKEASRFTNFLGDKSKAYCIAWDEFTGVKTLGLY